jgi:hypothetical protein
VTRRVLILVGGVAAFWLLLALPARHLGGGDEAVLQSGLAALLCLVPATAVLLWADWAFRQNPEQQMYAVLGGGGVRMFFVLSAGLVLGEVVGWFRGQVSFWAWLVLFYLFTLALEIGLMLKAGPKKST